MKIEGKKMYLSWEKKFVEEIYNSDMNEIKNPFPFHKIKIWNFCLFLLDEVKF